MTPPIYVGTKANPTDIYSGGVPLQKVYLGQNLVWQKITGPAFAFDITASSFTLQLLSTGTYDFTVFWGDGSSNRITTWDDSNKTHSYASSGNYSVAIYGTIQGWAFRTQATEAAKMTDITNWGPLEITDNSAFRGCVNMVITATDAPDISGTTTLGSTFKDCESIVTVPGLNDWNVSHITNMGSMFSGAILFNQYIGGWNTGLVTDMSNMFLDASSYNWSINLWDVSNVTDMTGMFGSATSYNQNMNSWNTANVTDMTSMFNNATNFNGNITSWNVSNVTSMLFMFANTNAFNQDLSAWVPSALTDPAGMFNYATGYTQIDFSWLYVGTSLIEDMRYFGIGSGITTTGYNSILVNLANNSTLVSNVTLQMGLIKYDPNASFVTYSRDRLMNTYNWALSDGGPI